MKVWTVPTGVVLFMGDTLPALGGRFTVQVPGVLELLAPLRSSAVIISKYGDPDKGGCGVRLNVTVNVVPEPEVLLVLQFKVRLPSEIVVACPGVQRLLVPCMLNLSVPRL